jgi:hypothetical protein
MKAILMFSGFQESEASQSGFERGFFNVVRKFARDEVTVYHPRTWKTNVINLLRQLYENGITEIAIVSYSHGQAAAMDLARLAPRYGVTISCWLACDPIYRPAWLPRSTWAQVFSFRAVLGSPKIEVPPAVREVWSVRQTVQKPCGHELVAADPSATKIHPAIVVNYGHTRIDESPAFWHLVRTRLTEFCDVTQTRKTRR